MKKVVCVSMLMILILCLLPTVAGQDGYDYEEVVAYNKETFRFWIGETEIVISDVFVDGAQITHNRTYNIDIDIGHLKRFGEVLIVKNGATEKTTTPLENKYFESMNILQYEHETFINTPPGMNVTFAFIFRNLTMQETFLVLHYDVSENIIVEDIELYNIWEERKSQRMELELIVAEATYVYYDEGEAFGLGLIILIVGILIFAFGVLYGKAKKDRAFMLPTIAATWDWNFFVFMLEIGIVIICVVVTDYKTLQDLFTYQYVEGLNVRATMAHPHDVIVMGYHIMLYIGFMFCFAGGAKLGYRIIKMPNIVNMSVVDTQLKPALTAQGYRVEQTIHPYAIMDEKNVAIPLTEDIGLDENGKPSIRRVRFRTQARRLIRGAWNTCPSFVFLYPERAMQAHWYKLEDHKGMLLNAIAVRREVDMQREGQMNEEYLNDEVERATIEEMKGIKTKEPILERERHTLVTPRWRPIKRWFEIKKIKDKENKLVAIFVPSRGMGNPFAVMNDINMVEKAGWNADVADEQMGIYERLRLTEQALPVGAVISQSDTTPFENLTAEEIELKSKARNTRDFWKTQEKRLNEEYAEGNSFGS